MQKVSLQQAVKMTTKSESTIRRAVKSGKLSAERDEHGHLKFDQAELMRVYGELKSTGRDAQSTDQGNDQAMTGHDREREITLLENQIDDLRNQLARTETQLDTATAEKTKLLDLTDRLQKQNETLMLPPPADEKSQKSPNWLLRLVGAR